ncbi:MAG: tetratricopeptide repeat protein [Gammaproteobacteria bacterium]
MSLINDMLKDLDRRTGRPTGAPAAVLQSLGLAGLRMSRPVPAGALAAGGLALSVLLAAMVFLLSNSVRLQPWQSDGTTVRVLEIPRVARPGKPAADAASTPPAETGPATAPVVEHNPVTDMRTPDTGRATLASAAAEAPHPEPAIETGGRLEVTPRPLAMEQQQARDIQAANRALSKGDTAGAERLLMDVLARDSGLHKARLLLAGLYLQQQRLSRAESLLASGLLHYPRHPPYARMYAQLLAAQARDSEAIHILQTSLPAAGDDADYHALLAGLYQRNGKAAAAADSYRTALRLAPAHGEWWMGLGISSEQAGDAQTAATAYRQALHYPLAAAVQQYVQQRLEQLTR